jgi:hypothetical protein
MAIEGDIRELIEDNSLTPYTSRKDDVVKTEEVTETEETTSYYECTKS